MLESGSLDLAPLLTESEQAATSDVFEGLVKGSNNIKVLFRL